MLLLSACGDDDGAATPDASVAIDAGSDAGASDAGGSDAGSDAGGCGARVTATIGPEGGTLAHCDGASLVVPPGAMASAAELSIERVASPPAPLAPHVLAGPAFIFDAPGVLFSDSVTVVLPHDGGPRMEMAAQTDEGWLLLESCEVTETTISQSFRALGTFVALHDPTPYPERLTGLGEGRIDFTFGGIEDEIDVDPEGHAIDQDPGEGRTLTLLFRRSGDSGFVQVDLRFTISAEGVVEPLQIQHYDGSVGEIWSADILAWPDDLDVTITRDEAGVIEGTIDATLHYGSEQTRPFTATFTARSELYRYPPERACELPEG
ncbi:hypothetical protein [Sandaracinus amylolyticus]|uniref:Uncharacterized protein n=1 Tax=Sandaracinus amylolyticus TaxID=927083 RepID=A0A0F6SI93_9BACT|nr:hypothetical protein [Sandaracinus amylolyticus]AKF11794.1 hypothetical protein DB32_008943 [Sandaracinus amylolyticus]